jgi:hypothetical protein
MRPLLAHVAHQSGVGVSGELASGVSVWSLVSCELAAYVLRLLLAHVVHHKVVPLGRGTVRACLEGGSEASEATRGVEAVEAGLLIGEG